MPPYYRWRYYRRKRPHWRRRHRWFRTRRTRKTFQPRYRRRRTVRRRYRIRRKLKKLKITEWQPKTIKKCRIKGQICLFQCGQGRIMHNYAQYQKSYVPPLEPGGGSWSSQIFTLGGLYDEYNLLHNWWTQSNDGLPLARFLGSKWKFYRSKHTDYIVQFQTCPPFTATEHLHLNSQPSRAIMNRHKIIVPKIGTPGIKKPYIKKWFQPPSQLRNSWYFQQDLCKTGLLLLTTTATSLDQYYLPQTAISDNVTLRSLNTTFFNNPNFVTQNTYGYRPKSNLYLFGTRNGSTPTPKWKELTYLGETQRYQLGTEFKDISEYSQITDRTKWGNPFHEEWTHPDTRLWYGTTWPSATEYKSDTIAKVTQLYELYFDCRYNPQRDTGDGNVIYFKSNSISTDNIADPPNNPNIILRGFPIWLAIWGWSDWQEKLKQINQIHSNYYLVIQSNFFEPKRPAYLFLDTYFTQPSHEKLTQTDKNHWYPKFEMQAYSLNNLAETGPGTVKINDSKSVQAHAYYSFYFKWGGCPAPMETIKDPCNQDKFPIPNQRQPRLEIQDPKTPKQYYLYDFDERKEQITKTAAQRLKTTTYEYSLSPEGNPLDPPAHQTSSEEDNETSDEEKEKETLVQQLKLLRQHQRHFHKQLKRLKQHTKLQI
nr:MAG: ORF1 [TTV-like mini virus]